MFRQPTGSDPRRKQSLQYDKIPVIKAPLRYSPSTYKQPAVNFYASLFKGEKASHIFRKRNSPYSKKFMKLSIFVFCLSVVFGQRNASSTSIPSTATETTTRATTTTTLSTTTTTTLQTSITSIVQTTTTSQPPPTATSDKQEKGASSSNAILITVIVVGSAILIAGIFIFFFRKFGVSPSKNFKNRLRQSFSPANHSAESTAVGDAPFPRKPSPPTNGGYAVYETTEVVPAEPAVLPQQYYGNAGYQQQYYADQNGYEYDYDHNASAVGYPYGGAQAYAAGHSEVGYEQAYDPHSQVGYDNHLPHETYDAQAPPPVPHKY